MKSSTRGVTRLVCAGLLAVLMIACVASPTGARSVSLKFYYPVQVAGPLAKVIEGMVTSFNREHPDIRVEAVYSGSYNETMQKAQTAVMSKNPPDVAVLLAIDILTLVGMDAVVPLDSYIARDKGYIDDFYPGFMENSQWGGHVWSIPFQRSTPLMYYNKDAFREAGLDPNKPPKTWDELLAYSQRLTKRDAAGNVTRWGLSIVTDDTWIIQAFILQNGGQYCNLEGTKTYFDTPESIGALQFWVDLANKYQVMPRHRFYGDAAADFVAGKNVIMLNSTGSLSFVRNSATFDFGVAPLPRHKQEAVPTGGGNFYVFKGLPKEREEAAWTFIKWMTSPERVAEWSIASGYIPVRRSAFDVPAMKEYVQRFPEALVARDQLQVAKREMALNNNQQIRETLLTALAQALDGKLSAEEALKRAQAEADRILRPWNR